MKAVRHARAGVYDYASELRGYARMFGPATCGCVAQAQLRWKLLTFEMQRRAGEAWKGWPACPICAGVGVDPRIPVPQATGIEDTEIPAFLVGAVLAAAIQSDMA